MRRGKDDVDGDGDDDGDDDDDADDDNGEDEEEEDDDYGCGGGDGDGDDNGDDNDDNDDDGDGDDDDVDVDARAHHRALQDPCTHAPRRRRHGPLSTSPVSASGATSTAWGRPSPSCAACSTWPGALIAGDACKTVGESRGG